jgi:hypothetical protein
LVTRFLIALLVALEFKIEMAAAVDGGKSLCNFARFSRAAVCQRGRKRAFVAAREADQSCGKLFEIVQRGRTLGLGRLAHLETRNELAEILVAGLRCAEQENARRLIWTLMRQPCRRREPVAKRTDCNLRADLCAEAEPLRSGVKARCAVETVAIGECHRREAQLHRALDERLRL